MSIFMIFIIAISLSMDAFSLSLIYGTLNLSKTIINKTSLTVGIFHFFMPLFGIFCGDLLSFFLNFNADLLVGIIFIVLAIQMIVSIFKEEKVEMLSGFISYFLFGFTVSVDSFSVGIGMGSIGANILLSCIIFSLTSAIFTYLGLSLGGKLASKFGKISSLIGSIILLWLGVYYIVIN